MFPPLSRSGASEKTTNCKSFLKTTAWVSILKNEEMMYLAITPGLLRHSLAQSLLTLQRRFGFRLLKPAIFNKNISTIWSKMRYIHIPII